jgi:hypothetical protein
MSKARNRTKPPLLPLAIGPGLSAAASIAFVWFGDIGFLLLAALYVVELVLVQILAVVVYNPSRRLVPWLRTALARTMQAALTGVFALVAWFAARAPAKDTGLSVEFDLGSEPLWWAAGWLGVVLAIHIVSGMARGDLVRRWLLTGLLPATGAFVSLVAMLPLGFALLFVLQDVLDAAVETQWLTLSIALVCVRAAIEIGIATLFHGDEDRLANEVASG